MTRQWQSWFFKIAILGTIQFLILTHLAMYLYKGGTIHDAHLDAYSFTTNFFSDLGRHRLFNGELNVPSNIIFQTTMNLTAVGIFFFFAAVPSLFKNSMAKFLAVLAALFGIASGVCYILIAKIPYDVDYWGHTWVVRLGFIAFLLMVFFYSRAIFLEKDYPNHYGYVFIIFGIILGIQIVVMILGPRSWRSDGALYLQAVAQKIVVYAEVLCMLYQAIGALRIVNSRQSIVDS